MIRFRLPILMMVLGVSLIAFSWIWPLLVGGRQVWNDDDALQLTDASGDVHALRIQFGSQIEKSKLDSLKSAKLNDFSPPDSSQVPTSQSEINAVTEKLAAAEERYRGLSAKLQGAQSRGLQAANAMLWIGFVTTVIGALGYYTVQLGSKE